jgi:hypothetical protein
VLFVTPDDQLMRLWITKWVMIIHVKVARKGIQHQHSIPTHTISIEQQPENNDTNDWDQDFVHGSVNSQVLVRLGLISISPL